MPFSFTTDELIGIIKKRNLTPIAQRTFSDQDMLDLGNLYLPVTIIKELINADEGFFIETYTQAFTTGVDTYALPQNAMFNIFRKILLVNPDGSSYPMTRMTEDDDFTYVNTLSWNYMKFVVTDKQIVFRPTPTNAGQSFSIKIYHRPGKMVMTSSAAKVQNINYTTGLVTYVSNVPATHTASSFHDFYGSNSPMLRLQTNIQATASTTNTQTFPVATVQSLSAGDWVCLYGETVFPPIPVELRVFLQEIIESQINRTQKDMTNFQILDQKILRNAIDTLLLTNKRAAGHPKKISAWLNPLTRS